MDFQLTPEQQRFKQEVHDFLERTLTPEFLEKHTRRIEGGYSGRSQFFSKMLAQRGWIGLAWPKQYGGQGLGYIEQVIYYEEMALHQAPIGFHFVGERQMGPSIILHGTEEQKQFYLPKIVNAEISFTIGYSEAEAGSDLASLQCRADTDGDDYLINGHKLWNSGGRGDYIWLATRTNQEAPKHKGISVFLVPLASPGIAIRPFKNAAGDPDFNEVRFENVRVPKSAMVGAKDQGWYVVAANLDFERSGIDRVARNYPLFQEFLQFVKETRFDGEPLARNPLVRHILTELQIQYEVGRLLCYQVAWKQSQGIVPNREASISKLFGTDTTQRMAWAFSRILGLYGQLQPGSKWVPLKGKVERAYMNSPGLTIAAGTSEIMRNIIAQRGLGLPRG